MEELDDMVPKDQVLRAPKLGSFSILWISMKSSDHSGRSRNEFPRVAPCSCDDPLGTGIRGEFSHAKSCDEDAVGSGDVLELEAASERLGKTTGT